MKLRIAYLKPEYLEPGVGHMSLPSNFTEADRFKAIVEHPEVEFYTPTDFAVAYNNDLISDLGYIAIDFEDGVNYET